MVMVQPNMETIFTFDGSTSFFIVLMFSPCFPFLFLFFFHAWIADEICANADEMPTGEECGGETPVPHPLATSLIMTVESPTFSQ